MPNIDVLILPLVAGYLFLIESNRTRFELARDNDQSTLLKSSLYGALFFIGSYIFWLIPIGLTFLFFGTESKFYDFLDRNSVHGPALLTLPFSVFLIYYSNKKIDPKEKRKQIIIDDGDAMENQILYSLTNKKIYLQITLKNGKVYVGKPTNNFFKGTDSSKSIRIAPLASGYRDPVTKKVNLRVNYTKIYKEIKHRDTIKGLTYSDFEVSITYSEIVSISYWNKEYFEKFSQIKIPSTTREIVDDDFE